MTDHLKVLKSLNNPDSSGERDLVSSQEQGFNPYKEIWFSPKKTISTVLKSGTNHSLILAMLSGAIYILNLYNNNIEEYAAKGTFSLGEALFVSLIFGPIAGILSLFTLSYLCLWVGRIFKGKAESKDIRTVLAYSSIPNIFMGWVPLVSLILYGVLPFAKVENLFSQLLIPSIVIAIAVVGCGIWSFIIFLKGLSHVQQFPLWKSIASSLIAFPLYLIAIIACWIGLYFVFKLIQASTFLNALFMGLGFLGDIRIWPPTFIAVVIMSGFLIAAGYFSNVEKFGYIGCFGMLGGLFGGLLLQGILNCGLVIYLLPIFFGQAEPANISVLTSALPMILAVGAGAAISVTALSFIPIIGSFIGYSRGIQSFLEGIIAFEFFIKPYIQNKLNDASIHANVYPNFWEYIGFAIVACVLEALLILVLSFSQVFLEGKADNLKSLSMLLGGPVLGTISGLAAIYMYISFVRLNLNAVLH